MLEKNPINTKIVYEPYDASLALEGVVGLAAVLWQCHTLGHILKESL